MIDIAIITTHVLGNTLVAPLVTYTVQFCVFHSHENSSYMPKKALQTDLSKLSFLSHIFSVPKCPRIIVI